MAEDEIFEIKERLLDELNRYRLNLGIILALKWLIESNDIGIETLPPERKIVIKNKTEKIPPDLILHDSNQNFVLNEIKTSLNPDENNLSQIQNYLNVDSVLDENGNPIIVRDHSVNLVVNYETYDVPREFFYNRINNKLIEKFSITTFVYSESVPKRGTRYYKFELRDNRTILEQYNNLLWSRPVVYDIDIQEKGEEIYFTNTPNVQYTITILWTMIIPSIKKGEEFALEDAQRIMRDYYCKWDETRVFFKIRWLRNAINKLLELKWIKEVRPNEYQIIKSLNQKKDFSEVICEKLAKLEMKERMRGEERQPAIQINLDKFLKEDKT